MLTRLESYLAWWNGLDRIDKDRFHAALRSNKIDPARKNELKTLAKHFIRSGISWSCGSCIQDAHYLLIRLKPEEMENKTLEYELYPGTILHDPINKNFDMILMPPKLTESLALYHLAFNARADKYFVKKPADIDKRIADFIAGLDDEMREKALPSAIEAFKKYESKPKTEAPKEVKTKTTKESKPKTEAPKEVASEPEGESKTSPEIPSDQVEA